MTPRHKRSDQSGFTLLELLLVVTLLSVTAFMTLSAVENNTDQVRFEDTRNRLTLIRKAIVGESQPVYNGQHLLSGYVVDNGSLPSTITNLLEIPVGVGTPPPPLPVFDDFAIRSPWFDPDPASGTGINDGTNDVEISGNEYLLSKGYRGGYLALTPGNENFKDGWGNVLAGSLGADIFTTTTPGKNQIIDAMDVGYERDFPDIIEEGDWSFDLETETVEVENEGSVTISAGVGGCFRVAFIVYVNNLDDPNIATDDDLNWRRVTSNCAPSNDLLVGTNSFTFPAPDAVQASMLIPQGEHLLLLVHDSDDSNIHTGTSETHVFDADSTLTGTQLAIKRVQFFAKVNPSLQLVVR